MTTILVTGGTGLIGRALTEALLERNYKIIILTRNSEVKQPGNSNLSYAVWNPQQQTIDEAAVRKADYIINLAGAGVADKRWTNKRKQEIINSRVKSGELIVKALRELPNNVKAVINASAIGWYGADPVIPNPDPFKEEYPADNKFLGITCKQWEESIEPVTSMGKRLVKLRTGIVLSNDGGALKEFKSPLRFGIATILGNGKQVISWIHIDDLVRIYIGAVEDDKMNGVYNAVAPAPASNKTLIISLAKIIKGQFFIPVYIPSFALKLVLGEMSIEVLKSATVSCDKIHQAGFVFQYPTLEAALQHLK